jgi:hypothetical protein
MQQKKRHPRCRSLLTGARPLLHLTVLFAHLYDTFFPFIASQRLASFQRSQVFLITLRGGCASRRGIIQRRLDLGLLGSGFAIISIIVIGGCRHSDERPA